MTKPLRFHGDSKDRLAGCKSMHVHLVAACGKHPPRSVGATFQAYIKTTEWEARALSARNNVDASTNARDLPRRRQACAHRSTTSEHWATLAADLALVPARPPPSTAGYRARHCGSLGGAALPSPSHCPDRFEPLCRPLAHCEQDHEARPTYPPRGYTASVALPYHAHFDVIDSNGGSVRRTALAEKRENAPDTI
jgi:hypothetical protein